MLEISHLQVLYGKHQALNDVSIRVAKGEIVVILGANGAGKSTLLKAIAGICEGKVLGNVTLSGHSLGPLGPDRIVEEGIALVPEGRGIFGDLSVEENLRLGAYPARAAEDFQTNLDRVFTLFPKLVERRRQIARTMSGGEQQMVAIGRAMMSSPEILMLDEPSLGLSPLLSKELFQNLRKVRDLGIGVLMVEQNARQSLAIADRGYLLENARVVHEDAASALIHDPAVQAAYLGGGKAAARAPDPLPESTPARLPDRFAVAPSPPRRQSADALAGLDIAALLARASDTARAPSPPADPMPVHVGASAPEIQTMLKEFEMAAAKCGKSRSLPPYVPRRLFAATDAPPKPAQQQPAQQEPVTIEVYRAPRVEIYRRRPDSGEFERD